MNSNDYLLGSDVIGADAGQALSSAFSAITAPQTVQGEGPFVTIHVTDLPGLVKSKAGAAGAFITNMVPESMTKKVYGDLRTKIAEGLSKEGVNADVKVVSTTPIGGPIQGEFFTGMAVGAGTLGLGYAVVKLFQHFLRGR